MYGRKLLILAGLLALGSLSAGAADKKTIPQIRQRVREAMTLAQASVRCDVHPKDAEVYVDGLLMGTVRDFNGGDERLYIFPGEHTLEFRHPDYQTYTTLLRLMPDQDMRVKVRMRKMK